MLGRLEETMDKKAASIIAVGLVVAALILGFVPKISSPNSPPVAAGGLVSVQVWKYPVAASVNTRISRT